MSENTPRLTPRLAAAASLVRKGAFISDVGTDHAYLPIALCLDGRARGGVVSDINAGPIARARENISSFGLDDRLVAIRTDGLCGIEKYAPEDILILGMGGELIASIINAAPWTRSPSVRLCLQPMTHPERLRAFLVKSGYSIIDERIAREDDKLYQLLLAEYSGVTEELTEAELFLGRLNIERGGEELVILAQRQIAALEKQARGIETGGGDASRERELAKQLKNVCKGDNV